MLKNGPLMNCLDTAESVFMGRALQLVHFSVLISEEQMISCKDLEVLNCCETVMMPGKETMMMECVLCALVCVRGLCLFVVSQVLYRRLHFICLCFFPLVHVFRT